jgi:hypothetical protein
MVSKIWILPLLSATISFTLSAHANQQPACPCKPLPSPLPAPSELPIIPLLPDPFTFRLSKDVVSSPADWPCRRAEIYTLVQEYLYGYYPDHSLEKVHATRVNNTLNITVTYDGKSGSFPATLTFPNGTTPSAKHPIPVVINPGYIDNNPFLASGVALATFNVNDVAIDSTAGTGAFWNLYGGRDIGVFLDYSRNR